MRNMVLVFSMTLLSACGFVAGQLQDKANEDRLLKPGALDLPLTGFYTHYQYKLLDKYQVSHQWIRESNCEYRKVELGKYESKDRLTKDRFFNVRDIFEEGGSTWQRFDAKTGNFNFDQYVHPQYTVKTRNGLKTEKGYNTLCYQSWWATSHSIALFLRKQPLDEMKAGFTQWYPEGTWTTKIVNNLTWHVQEVAEDKFRTRPLNGVAGPFQLWALPLADTGYSMAIKLGASKESLQYPDAHARMQAMFKHLIESVKIEPIQSTSGSAPHTPVDPTQPLPPSNHMAPGTSQPLYKSTSTTIREYPDKTQQLQQNIQNDSNRDMKNLLRNTAPKTNR